MELTGQAAVKSPSTRRRTVLDDAGFVMVALLVSMAVAAVWMGAALPAWRHQVQREREAELIFRGEAIARAIYLYRQKNGQTLPPNIDTLVSQRFLRKKYLDPITGEDFLPLAGQGSGPGGGLQGGVVGVRSTSNETSIRIYRDQQTYSQFQFDFTLEQSRAGGGVAIGPNGPIAPGASDQPGRGGGRQGGVGGRGRGGFGGRGVSDAIGGRGQPSDRPITPGGAGGRGPGGGGFGGDAAPGGR